MKSRFVLIATVAVAFSFAGTVQAATVDYTGVAVINMGLVNAGQSGTITDNLPTGSPINLAFGELPADTMITFTYSLGGAGQVPKNVLLADQGEYNFTFGKNHYSGIAHASTSPSLHEAQFAFASAGITGKPGEGTIATAVIGNTSPFATLLDFQTELWGFFNKGYTYSYNVTAVPLPGSLVLFASGLMALVIIGRRKRGSRA